MHRVLLQDVMPQYYAYMKYAMRAYSGDKPLWQVEYDREEFEDTWFTNEGISMVKADTEKGIVLCMLAFNSKETFMHWFLRWS